MMITCTHCQTNFEPKKYNTRYRWQKEGIAFCENNRCGYAHRDANRAKPEAVAKREARKKPPVPAVCSECGAECTVSGWTLERWRTHQRAYCSKDCSSAYRSRVSSETMARTNRVHASARMKTNNPMARDDVRLKMIASAKGRKFKIRGGNGAPPTKAEIALMGMFGPLGFVAQHIFRTGHKDPTHYKIDCANPYLRIAIEADGHSHASRDRQASDARKDARLIAAGWRVLRFTNQQILEQPSMVLSTTLRLLESTPTP